MELLRPIILLMLFSWGCSGPAPSLSHIGDSLLVDSREVVFFRQDSLRMEGIKAVLKDRVFESLTHDCYFEMKFARSVLQRDWPALSVMDVSAYRWLVFKKKNGDRTTIDLNAINDLCGVFLFDGVKDPIRATMPNIESQLWFYFGEGRK